jgi:hypothetical protein
MFRSVTQHRQVVKTFSSREAAGQAMERLVLSGFPIAQVFLFGNGTFDGIEAQASNRRSTLQPGSYGTITGTALGLRKGLVLGNFAGGMTGLVLGAGLIALPGVGQLVVSSAIAFMLLSGGICTAAGGLVGAMIGLGLTSEQAKIYSQQIARGSVLLVIEGTVQDLDRARYLLQESTV